MFTCLFVCSFVRLFVCLFVCLLASVFAFSRYLQAIHWQVCKRQVSEPLLFLDVSSPSPAVKIYKITISRWPSRNNNLDITGQNQSHDNGAYDRSTRLMWLEFDLRNILSSSFPTQTWDELGSRLFIGMICEVNRRNTFQKRPLWVFNFRQKAT